MFALPMVDSSYNLWGRWIRPTCWDRIKQEEPLEPVEARFEPYAQTVSSTPIIITHANGTNLGGTIRVSDGQYAGLYTITATATNISDGQLSTTAYLDGLSNYIPKAVDRGVYAVNRQQRKILEALGDKLPEAIRRAAKAIGKPDGSPGWNRRFFEQVSRAPTPATGRSPARSGDAQRRRAR